MIDLITRAIETADLFAMAQMRVEDLRAIRAALAAPPGEIREVQEVIDERNAQEAKWGEQNHPLLGAWLDDRPAQRAAEEHEIPGEARAKALCRMAASRGELTWAHILVEEVAEFVAARTAQERCEELIQVAAVAIAAVQSERRRLSTAPPGGSEPTTTSDCDSKEGSE
jgi:FtsZ-binding cell division protein ZapB